MPWRDLKANPTNASVYCVRDLDRGNVDEHIRYAKEGGSRRMLVYYRPACRLPRRTSA